MEETGRRGAPIKDQRLGPIVRTVQWSTAENMLRQPPHIHCRPTDSLAVGGGGVIGGMKGTAYSKVQLFQMGHTRI